MPLSTIDKQHLTNAEQSTNYNMNNLNLTSALDITSKIDNIAELQLVLNAYRGKDSNQKLKDAITTQAILLIKQDQTKSTDVMMFMLQQMDPANENMLDIKKLKEACIQRLNQEKALISSIKDMIKQRTKQSSSNQPKAAQQGINVAAEAIELFDPTTRITPTKFNLLQVLAKKFSGKRNKSGSVIMSQEDESELTKPLLQAVEEDERDLSNRNQPAKQSKLMFPFLQK